MPEWVVLGEDHPPSLLPLRLNRPGRKTACTQFVQYSPTYSYDPSHPPENNMDPSTSTSCKCPICVYDIDFIMDIVNSGRDYSEEFKRNGVDREYVEDWSITGRKAFQKPKKALKPTVSHCVFCKNNGLSEMEYSSHRIRDDQGICQCPILRKYKCPICQKVGGNNGHTIRYCPKNKNTRNQEILKATSESSRSPVTLAATKKRLSPIGQPVHFL